MILKKHKDFINENKEQTYHGYISDVSQIKVGDILIQYVLFPEGDISITEVTVNAIGHKSEKWFTTIEKALSLDIINNFNNYSIKKTEEENGMDEDDFILMEEDERVIETNYNGNDSKGFYYIDHQMTGGYSYFKFKDNSKNLDSMKTINKYNL